MEKVWFDVGAFVGRETLPAALVNGDLTVHAFEPNLDILCQVVRVAPNWIPYPFAVSYFNGYAELNITRKPWRSSLLSLDEVGAREWRDGVKIAGKKLVPVIRLDTFMERMNIDIVDFLKVDTQGNDVNVLVGLGERIKDVKRIKLEVQIARSPYYGAHTKDSALTRMKNWGFKLVGEERQSEGLEENLEFENERF